MKFLFAAIVAISVLTVGLAESRTPWVTSRVVGSPEPPKSHVQETLPTGLVFAEALELAPVPGTGRMLLLERRGKLFSFHPTDARQPVEPVIDLLALRPDLEHAFGVVLHPNYRENREIFLCYALTSGRKDGTKLSRFKLSSLSPLRADPASEEVLVTWLSGEHNGANLQFGPDGYLYFTAGDAAPPSPPDLYLTGQDNTDLLAAILRIDVDHRDPPLPYRIPADNPWAQPTPEKGLFGSVVRPEIWAFGLRNAFKMSFDRATGNLWCGDVGWELWEMIHLIKKGGNYGWSAYEAHQPIVVERASALAPITPPVVTHPHSEAASITGGFVYHGSRLPELAGAYVYGDWVTGKIWALWHDGSRVTRHEEIADTPHNIVSFGQDDAGEIYYLHYGSPTSLHRLTRNPKSAAGSSFPRKLSETGVYADVVAGRPSPGVYPFAITSPMWEDGAQAIDRLIALPDNTRLKTIINAYRDTRINKMITDYHTRWPAGSVLARTVTLGDLALTDAERSRRIETQLLHYDGEAWNAYSYRWNEAGTDADLVPATGDEVELRVRPDPQALDQDSRLYRYRFQSRAECLRCHNTWNNGALAFTAAQLRGVSEAQSRRILDLALAETDFFEQTRVGAESQDTGLWAARSVLHANCAHCHRSDAGGAVAVVLNTELTTGQMNAVGVAPSQGGLGLKDPKLIDPGDPWNSVIVVRMAKTGNGHMPIIGAREPDVKGLKTLEDWIARMTSDSKAPKPWTETTWTPELIDQELKTVNGAMRLRRAVDDGKLSVELRRHAFTAAWASPEPTVRDLYERFKPDHLRERTLGAQIDAKELLSLRGDATRGAALVATEGKLGSCQACHVFRGQGRLFGPDLSLIGGQQSAAQILDSILHPSATIAPIYRTMMIETTDGNTQVGFVLERRAQDLALKIPSGQTLFIPLSTVRSEKALPQSLMPEGLLQGLTPQEAADLIAYLSSLK